jgi:hypothetical protein
MNKKVNIEKLLEKRGEISNSVIKSALKKAEEQREKEQEEMILARIGQIQTNTENAVATLRSARKKEKAAKAYLQAMADAEQKFYTDADYNAYRVTENKAIHDYNRAMSSH